MTTEEKLYGCYSESARQVGTGVFLYTKPDGTEIAVTGVYSDPGCQRVFWPDKVLIGEVVKFVRCI